MAVTYPGEGLRRRKMKKVSKWTMIPYLTKSRVGEAGKWILILYVTQALAGLAFGAYVALRNL
jgi:hypothetical protein